MPSARVGLVGLSLVLLFIFLLGHFPSTRHSLVISFDLLAAEVRLGLLRLNDPCFKSSGRTPTDGRWFNYSSVARQLYAYTAFYDDRPSLAPGKPVVRIIGFITVGVRCIWQRQEDSPPPPKLRCKRHYADGRWTVAGIDENAMKLSDNCEKLNGEFVREYIFTCPLEPSGDVPLAIAILTDDINGTQSDDFEARCMPVERPIKLPVVRDFAICMQVAFGHVDVHRMIEWIELQRLLGVSKIVVYELVGSVHSLANESVAVLQHYAAEGFVELRKTEFIPDGPKQVS